MKKLKLFLAAFAAMVSLGVNAQTAQTIVDGDMANQWTTHTRTGASNNDWGKATSGSVNCFETWRGHGTTAYEMSQEVTLPAGSYVFQAYAFYRKGADWNTNPSVSEAVIFAGTTEKAVWSLGGVSLGSYPTNQTGAAAQFANGYYMNTVEFTLDSEQTISIGCKGTHSANDNSWFVMGPASLYKVDNAGITGNYYLKNSGNGEYFFSGNNWGTHAVTSELGYAVKIAAMDGGYSIDTHVTNGGASHFLGGEYTDGGKTAFTFEPTGEANEYYIKTSESKYLTAGTSGTDITLADATSDNAKWKLETLSDHETVAATALATKVATLDAATNADPVDATFYIPYATLKRNNQHMYGYWSEVPSVVGNNPKFAYEYFNKNFDIHQTVTGLKTGKYALTVNAYYRAGGNGTTDADTKNTILYANGVEVAVPNSLSGAAGDDAGTGSNLLAAGNYKSDPVYVYVTDGTLTLGLKKTTLIENDWTLFNYFNLKYHGTEAVTTEYANALIATIPETLPTAVTENLNSLKTTLLSTLSKSDYDALASAIETANNAILPAYTLFNTVKAAALALNSQSENYTDEGDAAYTALTNAATTQQTAVDEATTAEAINTAIANLRSAACTFAGNITLGTDKYLDMTNVMVTNPTVRTSTSGWTIYNYDGYPNTKYSNGVVNYEETEFYQQQFKFYQSLALTPGTWEFGVTGFHRAGNHSTYFYAGEDKILIPGVESSVVNSMAEAKTYFDSGNGQVSLKFIIETAGDVEIGINNQDTETDKWTIFRNFTLKYYGAVDYSVYENQWAEAVTAANTAKTTYPSVTGSELTALDAAIADAPDGSSKANYLEKIQALSAATQTFTAAASDYDAYVAYRAETVALFGEEVAATVTAPTTAAGAVTAVQNLNIAQYNKVAHDYTYSLNGLIGDFGTWTATATVAGEAAEPNYLTNEHWSAATHAYYEQASTGWGNANGWTIKYEKKCTLPAGSYVIKVAARSSAGTTSLVSCDATSTTIALPNVGAASRGITTSGVASWDDSETYANNTGYGWQWRFLPFTLDAETEVTMIFYAEASSQYQWMSIADGELLSANDVATAVAYNETATNTVADVAIANVTVTRSIKEGFNTVVLPFDLTANQVTTAFGTGAVVYNYTENSDNAESAEINFTSGDGSIKANVPVLVKATAASTAQTFNGVKVVAATDTKVAGTNFDFVGIYSPLTAIEAGDYFIGNGALYKSAGATSLKGFRAYLDNKNPSAVKAVNLYIDGVATAISEINADAENTNGLIFNLAGQRVSKAQKGLYIINGKKVLVK